MIKDSELEKRVLTGMVQHQKLWGEVVDWISEKDFYSKDSKVHISIFKIVRAALNNAESIDDTILISRIKSLGTTFPDSIDLPEYIRCMFYFDIPEEVFLTSIKDLKKVTLRRELYLSAEKVKNYALRVPLSTPYREMVDNVDKLHNDTIADFEAGDGSKCVNLSELAEPLIEGIGDNPPDQVGIMTPYDTINRIYGSTFLGGNIACYSARAGVGKTTLLIDNVLRTSYNNDCLPVLHFDNGEMSEKELVMRMVSSFSGVPQYMLQDGSWRKRSYGDWSVEEVVQRVRDVWNKIKKTKILYDNVAGLSSEEMCALLKRRYYSEVGRGEQMLFSFDYLKTDFNNLGKGDNWAFVGKVLHDMKQTITKDLKFDGENTVSMITSCQLNRAGISSNKDSNSVQEIETENAIGLSDFIIQFCSHMFLLRPKTIDERGLWGERFGTHNLVGLKARHLGEDLWGYLNPVEMPNGPARKNFVNLDFKNFKVTDCGDLRDIVKYINNEGIIKPENTDGELPEGLK